MCGILRNAVRRHMKRQYAVARGNAVQLRFTRSQLSNFLIISPLRLLNSASLPAATAIL